MEKRYQAFCRVRSPESILSKSLQAAPRNIALLTKDLRTKKVRETERNKERFLDENKSLILIFRYISALLYLPGQLGERRKETIREKQRTIVRWKELKQGVDQEES